MAVNVYSMMLACVDDGWYLYLQEERGGQKERIKLTTRGGDHQIVRHGELVGKDATEEFLDPVESEPEPESEPETGDGEGEQSQIA